MTTDNEQTAATVELDELTRQLDEVQGWQP